MREDLEEDDDDSQRFFVSEKLIRNAITFTEKR
jgi:hypothetical protein